MRAAGRATNNDTSTIMALLYGTVRTTFARESVRTSKDTGFRGKLISHRKNGKSYHSTIVKY